MSIFASKSTNKSPFLSADRMSDAGSAQPENGLQKQAGQMLCQKDCNAAFTSRMSAAGNELPLEQMAHAAEDKDALKSMNADADQTAGMLYINPVTELFDQLKDQDRAAAVDFAVKNTAMHATAMNTGDAAFDQEVRLKVSGNAVA